mgnify:CR=1 FL=1
MAKKLNIKNLNSAESKLFTKKTVIVKDKAENEYEVVVDNGFRESKIMEIITELQVRSEYFKLHELEDFNPAMLQQKLLLQHFTDIKFPELDKENPLKTFSKEADLLKSLIDIGVYEQIMNSFRQEDVDFMRDLFVKYSNNIRKINDNILQMLNKEQVKYEPKEEVDE